MKLNGELARYLILLVTSPLWWPFLRELYKEMDNALREDGGLLGRTPKAKEEQAAYTSPLVSTPFREPGSRQPAQRTATPASGQKQAGAPAAPERRRGFRDR